MKNFLIIAELRSGYQFLSTLLNSNPKILCFGEVFGRRKEVREQSLFQHKIPASEPMNSAVAYVENTLGPYAANIGKESFGFKLNYNDCREEENWRSLWNHVSEEKWNIIHLQRHNILDRALSQKLAIKQWRWNHEQYDTQVRITFDELNWYYESSMKWRQWANEFFHDSQIYNLYYEDLVGLQNKKYYKEIQEFIGVSPVELRSNMKKQRVGGQSTFLVNYRHLYNQCIKHPIYKSFLTDIPIT